jgi:hypothetical protein
MHSPPSMRGRKRQLEEGEDRDRPVPARYRCIRPCESDHTGGNPPPPPLSSWGSLLHHLRLEESFDFNGISSSLSSPFPALCCPFHLSPFKKSVRKALSEFVSSRRRRAWHPDTTMELRSPGGCTFHANSRTRIKARRPRRGTPLAISKNGSE